jgi:hypothetical protein
MINACAASLDVPRQRRSLQPASGVERNTHEEKHDPKHDDSDKKVHD